MSGAPHDLRAAALDVLASMRYPNVSNPPAGHVRIIEGALRAAYLAGVQGRPMEPPK